MAIKEYLDGQGLARLAEDLEVRHPSTFFGERDVWDALSSADKEKYKVINFTDESRVYLYDKTNDTLSPFIAVIHDVNSLPSSDIQNTIYRLTPTVWTSAEVTLSSSDMDTNTTNLESIGFTTEVEDNLYTYTPSKKNIRYSVNDDSHDVGSLTIDSSDATLSIYDLEGTVIYTGTIVDGDYQFFTKDLISFWLGDQVTQTCERIATYRDITGGGIETIQSLQDIFNISSEQIVIGDNSLEFLDGDGSIDLSDSTARSEFEAASNLEEFSIGHEGIELSNTAHDGNKAIDFKMDRKSVEMNADIRKSFRLILGIPDVDPAEAIIAPIDLGENGVAGSYHSSGYYFINGDKLYKALTSISSGTKLVEGENVTRYTVVDLLDLKQDQNISRYISINGTRVTTVEEGLDKLNDYKANAYFDDYINIDGYDVRHVLTAVSYMNDRKLNISNIASDFDSSVAYETGDIVMYDGKIYQFTDDKAAGDWDSEVVEQIILTSFIKSSEPNELTENQVNTLLALLD